MNVFKFSEGYMFIIKCIFSINFIVNNKYWIFF